MVDYLDNLDLWELVNLKFSKYRGERLFHKFVEIGSIYAFAEREVGPNVLNHFAVTILLDVIKTVEGQDPYTYLSGNACRDIIDMETYDAQCVVDQCKLLSQKWKEGKVVLKDFGEQ